MAQKPIRGSLWNQWDLHVHTPDSLVYHYPGSNKDAWTRFINDLEKLPDSFKVIGINDYLFLDGYRRVLDEKRKGRLSNIELVLPVVELRLNVFGGSESRLSKVNYHVIFSDELDPDIIENHFIRALTRKFQLLPQYYGTDIETQWSGSVSREALETLGAAIIEAAPTQERDKYGSPLLEGFNNLTVSQDNINEALESSFLKHRYVTAAGKTEWADIKWQDGSIADKRHIINSVDCVFTSAETVAAYNRSKKALQEGLVNDKLLDCSDAHYFSDSNEKDRIGNCWTWLKADVTFNGLLQALEEFEQRVFVGEEPDQLRRIREHPSRFIKQIVIQKKKSSQLTDNWFHGTDLPLNPGMIAIIGNKGSGKSALAETIAVAAGTSQQDDLSFLHSSRFRDQKRNLASHFKAKLTWYDGADPTVVSLDDDAAVQQEVRVRHLPQKYLENLCNEVPRGDKTQFDKELERIIFSHLRIEDRLGAATLDELLSLLSLSIRIKIESKRKELRKVNQQIWKSESDLSENNRAKLLNSYRTQRREWWELKSNPPDRVLEPTDDDPTRALVRKKIEELQKARGHLLDMQTATENRLSSVRRELTTLDGIDTRLRELEREFKQIESDLHELLVRIGKKGGATSLSINWELIQIAKQHLKSIELDLAAQLDDAQNRSFPSAIKALDLELENLEEQLTALHKAYQRYVRVLEEWQQKVRNLVGTSDTPGTLLWYMAELNRIQKLPHTLEDLKKQRLVIAAKIHEVLLKEANQYASLYTPLQKAMDRYEMPIKYRLEVETSLVENSLAEQLLETYVNRQVAGSFSGVQEGQQVLDTLISQTDFNDVNSVQQFLVEVEDRFHYDYRKSSRPKTSVENELRKGITPPDLYNKLFSLDYLSPRYGLKFGQKPIYQLSPGEKGILLLMFFLLADTEMTPLIVDQPEDNLDNQTVFQALVKAFRITKKRRQVFIVTHNPNLAVVCDADQVIIADMKKSEENRIEYRAGSIEKPYILKHIIDILEGTKPAFNNRRIKYVLHQFGDQS